MLKIENFSKTYPGGNRAVDHLSLEVRPGDVFGFIGHNGAGKTTTIRAITGVMDFSEGNIWVDGESVRENPLACKRKIAFVPDNPDLYDYLTGIQYSISWRTFPAWTRPRARARSAATRKCSK